MSTNTCGGCPHLNTAEIWRGAYSASCGLTSDELGEQLIVPHHWESKTITLWRVPEFCQNPDKTPSAKKAPRKDWVKVTI